MYGNMVILSSADVGDDVCNTISPPLYHYDVIGSAKLGLVKFHRPSCTRKKNFQLVTMASPRENGCCSPFAVLRLLRVKPCQRTVSQ